MDIPILIIGDSDPPEFREAAEWLLQRGALPVADIAAAIGAIQGDSSPAIIVILERWPGQFSHRESDELRRAAPLARSIGLLGPWLEGETRTGKPWPTLVRKYWHQATASIEREIEAAEQQQWSALSLPLTAGEDERLLSAAADVPSPSASEIIRNRTIAICAAHRETAEALSDICGAQEWSSLWLRELPRETPLRVDAILLDTIYGAAAELKKLPILRKLAGDTPIIALIGFPRLEDVELLKAAGAAAVVSKPFSAADLIWQIEQLFVANCVA